MNLSALVSKLFDRIPPHQRTQIIKSNADLYGCVPELKEIKPEKVDVRATKMEEWWSRRKKRVRVSLVRESLPRIRLIE